MKKILSFTIILAVSLVTLVGCSKKQEQKPKQPQEKPFVTQTKKNLYKWIDKYAVNPEDFKVSRLEVIWKTDSLCVLNFRVIAENGFGGHIRKECQYFNIKMEGNTYEWFDEDRYGNGVLDGIKEMSKGIIMEKKYGKKLAELSKNKTEAGEIYKNAYIDAFDIPYDMISKHGTIVKE